jgi:hypothetical protein
MAIKPILVFFNNGLILGEIFLMKSTDPRLCHTLSGYIISLLSVVSPWKGVVITALLRAVLL